MTTSIRSAPRYEAHGRGRQLQALPDTLAWLLECLVNQPEPLCPGLSPDGQTLFHIRREDAGASLIAREVASGLETVLIRQDASLFAQYPSPDGRYLAFDLSPGVASHGSVFVMDLADRRIQPVKAAESAIYWVSGWLEASGRLVVWTDGFATTACGLYVIEHDGAWSPLFKAPGICWLADASPDGRRALVLHLPQHGLVHLYEIDLATRQARPLVPLEFEAEVGFAHYSECGKYIHVVSNLGADRYYLGTIPVSTAQPALPTPLYAKDDADLSWFAPLERGTAAVMRWTSARSEVIETASMIGPALQPLGSREFASIPGLSAAATRIAVCAEHASRPKSIQVLDLALRVQGPDHSHADLADLVLQEPEFVEFSAHDGLLLSGWLYRAPPAEGQAPRVVLYFHGGPEAHELSEFRPLFQTLLAAGISVFAPNVRGSTGRGRRFSEMDNGALRRDAIQDIAACAELMLAWGMGLPGRLGIMGRSYGGYMTLAGLSAFPAHFAAGVSICGIGNFLTLSEQSAAYMREIYRRKFGDPDTERDMLKALSPCYRFASVEAPILFIHGENDGNVPYTESLEAFRTLVGLGKDAGLLSFPGEGHSVSGKKNQITERDHTVRWFLQFL